MKLNTRLFFILIGMALVPLTLSVFWQIYTGRATQRSVQAFHQNVADLMAAVVTDWDAGVNRRLAFLYDLEKSPAQNRLGNAFKIFQQATAGHSDILSATLLAPDGSESLHLQAEWIAPVTDIFAQDPLVRQVKASHQAAFGEVRVLGNEPAIPYVYPLPDGSLIHLYFSLAQLWKRMGRQTLGQSGRVFIIDAQAHPLPGQSSSTDTKVVSLIGDPEPDRLLDPEDFEPSNLSAALGQAPQGLIASVPSKSGELTGAYRRLEALPWTIVTLQRRSEAFWAQERMIYGFVLFFGVSLAVALIAARLFSGQISHPLLALVEGARRVAAKDLSYRVAEDGWAEIKSLSIVFNGMTTELQKFHDLQIEKIIAEKTKAETLVRIIPDGVLLTDESDAVIYGNMEGLRLLGLETKDDASVVLPDAVTEPIFRAGLEQVFIEPDKHASTEVTIDVSTDPPVQRTYKIISSPYSLVDERHGRVILVRDITNEVQLDQMHEELFLMIAHDIRGSLSIIQGNLDLAMRQDLTVKGQRFVTTARTASGAIQGMVNDILNLNKMESGNLELYLRPVDVGELLARAQEGHKVLAGMKSVEIVFEPVAPPLTLLADGTLLERVLANLIGNAIKFTPSGGKITLSCRAQDDEHVTFCVADTGPGIPEDKKEFIFEKFKQLEGAGHMGFGLGLAMCKMAAELHGGKIWVESQLGHGSQFIFTVSRKLEPKESSPVAGT